MNVAELKTIIEPLPDDLDVLVSTDAEGNKITDVYEAELSKVRDDGYEWDVLHPDDTDGTEPEALVIWPI